MKRYTETFNGVIESHKGEMVRFEGVVQLAKDVLPCLQHAQRNLSHFINDPERIERERVMALIESIVGTP